MENVTTPEQPSMADMAALIHRTLQETIADITSDLDALRAAGPENTPPGSVEKILDQTRRLTVFLKYAGDYLRRALPEDPIREEMLRIKLHLLSVLRSLVEAVRARDAAVVHDLLTEELRDNLIQWKITILPLVRSKRPSPSISPRN